MSQQTRQTLSHDFVFHGKKEVSSTSEQITGIGKIGWMHITSNNDTLYIGASGVGDNGLPLAQGGTFPVVAASLDKFYVSGSGSVNFLGAYSN